MEDKPKLSIEDVDSLFTREQINRDITAKDVYRVILSHPWRYLTANGHLKKFVFLSFLPFLVLIKLLGILQAEEIISFKINLTIQAFGIWIFLNKNTVYTIVKLFMFAYSLVPSSNTLYSLWGKWFTYKSIYIILFIIVSWFCIGRLIWAWILI